MRLQLLGRGLLAVGRVPAQCSWRCIEFVRLSFGTLSSARSRQVAVGRKRLLAQVALYFTLLFCCILYYILYCIVHWCVYSMYVVYIASYMYLSTVPVFPVNYQKIALAPGTLEILKYIPVYCKNVVFRVFPPL